MKPQRKTLKTGEIITLFPSKIPMLAVANAQKMLLACYSFKTMEKAQANFDRLT